MTRPDEYPRNMEPSKGELSLQNLTKKKPIKKTHSETCISENNNPEKNTTSRGRRKSRSECGSPAVNRKYKTTTSCDCKTGNCNNENDNDDCMVEFRHKFTETDTKDKKSRSSLKVLRRSFRRSFGIKRSKSCTEPRDDGNSTQQPLQFRRNKTGKKANLELKLQPLVLPAPLVIEDPPSNDDDSPDLEEHIKYLGDPALLNGSSGNFGSAGPRSAPTTPQGVFCGSTGSNSSLGLGTGQTGGLVINALGIGTQQQLQAGQQQQQTQQDQQLQLQQPFGGAASQPCTPGCTSPSIQRSPSHSVFTKCDKTNLKHLSTSTPQMTAQGQLTEPPSPKAYKEGKVRTTSKSHQKKFRRHFQNVNEEEVLNHYLCALIGDILLQGHLYITTNYFAFYSNVFGYVTKLLIPVLSVEKITKEKTARIIPNAVGIQTSDDKHVFGSLMSRDTTMQYMITVWQKAKNVNSALPIPPEVPDITPEAEIESSESAESGRDSPIDDDPPTFKKCDVPLQNEPDIYERRSSKGLVRTVQEAISEFSKLPRQSLILFATTLLLILLFLSAGILLYRISKIQNRYSLAMQDSRSAGGEEIYSNLLQWQSHLHTKSAGAVNNFLDSNLDQIAKVRQSLEALSTLLISKENPLVRQDETSSASDKTTLES